jgi:Domain of unknown function (DUF6378)
MSGDQTSQLLLDRGKTHGEFGECAAKTQRLKRVMSNGRNWPQLSDTQRTALEMIAHKISRILTGDPDFTDHWRDIAGYAALIVEELEGRE